MNASTDRPSRYTRRGRAPGDDPRPTGVGTLAVAAIVPLMLVALSNPLALLGVAVGLLGVTLLVRAARRHLREFREAGHTEVGLPFGISVELVARPN